MLYLKTINDHLQNALRIVMDAKQFDQFRLVGGTALSLQIGHRESVDIDLFTDCAYGDIDFGSIDRKLKKVFLFVDSLDNGESAFGKSYFVGASRKEMVKLDVFYTDKFIQEPVRSNGIRMA